MQIQHNRIKTPTGWAGGNQLAIYKRGRGFKLGTTENKSSKWPERGIRTQDRRIGLRIRGAHHTLPTEFELLEFYCTTTVSWGAS